MSNRREFIRAFAIAGGTLLITRGASGRTFAGLTSLDSLPYAPAADPWSQVPKILRRIKPPTFPRRDFNITRYGAGGDGKGVV